MAFVYWLHYAEESDFLTQGYIGACSDLKNRLRSHKHRLKDIWDKVIVTKLVESTIDYCFELEQKLRPERKIGWNTSAGGYRNNVMHGEDNPNFGKVGEQAPHFVGWYITPLGEFARPEDAAKIHGCNLSTIVRRCRGRNVNGKFLPAKTGYAFKQKDVG
jgi:hypothetical protein